MFTFTPLLGAQADSAATQSLLEFDGGVKILVDVGWDESFDTEQLRELERQAPSLSFILLTHATISHLGAFAYCCKHIPLFSQIPVYATTPVISLGRTLLQDLYNSTPLAASFLPRALDTEFDNSNEPSNILLPPPSPEEIANYFSLINALRYSQTHQPTASPFSPPLEGLTITAYCAGHTLGGTIWHIQHGSESVVYAVDWNQGRENVLPGAAWLGGAGATGAEIIEQLRQPTALVCSSKGADIVALAGGLRRRDELLLSHIRDTISAGGSVLLPCDASARALELAYMLERAWSTDSTLRQGKLFFASSTSTSTMRYARSMLEWMEENVIREFEASSNQKGGDAQGQLQPFSFKHVKMIERKSQVTRALAGNGPKVFLSSDSSLEWGFSRTLLESIAKQESSLIILGNGMGNRYMTKKGSKIIGALHGLATSTQDAGTPGKDASEPTVYKCENDEVEVEDATCAALAGNELSTYQQYLARQRQKQTTFDTEQGTKLESSADVVDEQSSDSSSSDEDEDAEHQGKVLNVSNTLAHPKHKMVTLNDEDLGINVLLRRKDVHDYDVRGKRGREKLFPFMAKRRRNDDFGDIIRPEDFLRAEEREETGAQDEQDSARIKGDTTLGQKRRWDDKDNQGRDPRRPGGHGSNKRRKLEENRAASPEQPVDGLDAADNDESDESDYEPEETVIRGPMRVSYVTRKIQLKMKIMSLDLSGIHDKRSLHMLIPLIRPRKLILTGGNKRETESLAEACRTMLLNSDNGSSKATAADILTPLIGVSVDASVDTNAWTIKLDQKLYKRLKWQNFRSLGIVTIHGCLELPVPEKEDEQTGVKRQKIASPDDAMEKTAVAHNTSGEASLPVLADIADTMASRTAAIRPTNRALHVGDLRLAELRRIMQGYGHTAEFKGEGTLLVDGTIAVRKSGIGKIEVESGGSSLGAAVIKQGATSGSSFFDVKKRIYEGIAVVAAR